MSDFDKLIVRSWSAAVARGGEGNATEVYAEMRKAPGLVMECANIAIRLDELRAIGALPS